MTVSARLFRAGQELSNRHGCSFPVRCPNVDPDALLPHRHEPGCPEDLQAMVKALAFHSTPLHPERCCLTDWTSRNVSTMIDNMDMDQSLLGEAQAVRARLIGMESDAERTRQE